MATKYDLLATEPDKLKVRCCARVCVCRCASLTRVCTSPQSWTDKFSSSRQGNLFALGTRDAIFQQLESDAIVPHEGERGALTHICAHVCMC